MPTKTINGATHYLHADDDTSFADTGRHYYWEDADGNRVELTDEERAELNL